jgi:hypothetical protein
MRFFSRRPTAAALRGTALGIALLVLAGPAAAQDRNAGGIYSCVDSKGRRLTSDRPIPECLDREQRQLGSSGVVKRVVPPSYTADERAKIEAQKKNEEIQRARVAEEKRRDRALMVRYPTQAMHDKERAEALGQIDEVVGAVNKRVNALGLQRKEIDTELEFYQGDVKKAPSWLQRKLEDNEQQVAVQKRFLADQAQEKQRINGRFDEELTKLRQLWANGVRP